MYKPVNESDTPSRDEIISELEEVYGGTSLSDDIKLEILKTQI